ncbi:Wzz/FepE/Etk N-terminal domain-containing protein [Vogesella sp. DC21W]|uniref:Wzz/FepE/Etk N-terminal domain-containing protein n=1 Tax=Vogesella aquatica TaxID=2984206 RepID=A0ABT5IX49_9NEIS|nr:Wzz/FepE/Etk N-terminal domain-containing protein [Vogesella aquatica]MDC7717143.1 Wzz/FepE/Etk N-terminal domain-containing protein [Vogesella aquatica]
MTPSEHYAEEQDELSLIELLTVLVVHRRLIAVCVLIFAALGLSYAYVIKTRTFTATATIITNKNDEIGIATETMLSLAQSEGIKQPLIKQLEKDGFITEADIINDLDGTYTASLNNKTSQIQLSLKLDDAAAAQKNINDTAERIVAEAKRMQLSTVSQKISKLDAAKADVAAEIAAISVPAGKADIDQNEFLAYALPIAALESSVIMQGGEKQLVQKMQENAVSLMQGSKTGSVNDRQKKDLFIHTYKTLVQQNIEKELKALKQQEQSIVIAMPATIPKKADRPGRALIVLLFMLAGVVVGCCTAFIRAAIDKSQHNPETKEQWQRLRNALRS